MTASLCERWAHLRWRRCALLLFLVVAGCVAPANLSEVQVRSLYFLEGGRSCVSGESIGVGAVIVNPKGLSLTYQWSTSPTPGRIRVGDDKAQAGTYDCPDQAGVETIKLEVLYQNVVVAERTIQTTVVAPATSGQTPVANDAVALATPVDAAAGALTITPEVLVTVTLTLEPAQEGLLPEETPAEEMPTPVMPTPTDTATMPPSTPTAMATVPTPTPLAAATPTAAAKAMIKITEIPPLGTWDAYLRGRVEGVDTSAYRVACYIQVFGTWWTKPTYEAPVVVIATDGRWECLVTTGGQDASATQLAAFLVPADYAPPNAEGISALPPELYANAVAYQVVDRTDMPGAPQPTPITLIGKAGLLEVTEIPPAGVWGVYLRGRVHGVEPAAHRVACYIEVNGGWWTKPAFDQPMVAIDADGNWECLVTTGGINDQATHLAAFLIPASYTPPPAQGSTTLPTDLDTNALDLVVASRPVAATQLRFSGYAWTVKSSSQRVGPGPNFFSDRAENVWVDAAGYLHLRLTQRNQVWYAAEIISAQVFSYGEYRFYLQDGVQFDERVVLGLFTWDDDPAYHHGEIDIEFSRWGNPVAPNAQFVVQPWDHVGNLIRFPIDPDLPLSLHVFIWQPDAVEFRSIRGHLPTASGGDLLQSWRYDGPDVPVADHENVRLNLWLVNGQPPANGQEVEVVVTKFEFVPG